MAIFNCFWTVEVETTSKNTVKNLTKTFPVNLNNFCVLLRFSYVFIFHSILYNFRIISWFFSFNFNVVFFNFHDFYSLLFLAQCSKQFFNAFFKSPYKCAIFDVIWSAKCMFEWFKANAYNGIGGSSEGTMLMFKWK